MTKITCTCAAIAAASAFLWATAYERPAAQAAPAPRAAAARAGAPAGTWTPTRRKDGQPGIEGIYQSVSNEGVSSGVNLEPMTGVMGNPRMSPGIIIDPPDKMVPYLPWARVRRDEVRDHHLTPNQAQVDTRNRGWPDGVPRINYYFVNPFQIIQPSGGVVILYEAQHEFRYIPLDGRPQIDNGVKLWMGSSRGRWEGNTLVVDVANISDRVRLSIAGDFASDQLNVTERWTWVDRNTIKHTATFVDPKVFTRPFTVAMTIKRLTESGFEIMEYSGVEGEKDANLMVDIPVAVKEQEKK